MEQVDPAGLMQVDVGVRGRGQVEKSEDIWWTDGERQRLSLKRQNVTGTHETNTAAVFLLFNTVWLNVHTHLSYDVLQQGLTSFTSLTIMSKYSITSKRLAVQISFKETTRTFISCWSWWALSNKTYIYLYDLFNLDESECDLVTNINTEYHQYTQTQSDALTCLCGSYRGISITFKQLQNHLNLLEFI